MRENSGGVVTSARFVNSSFMKPRTMHISEIQPGIFYAILPRCSYMVLQLILKDQADHIWLVNHRPQSWYAWNERTVPLSTDDIASPFLINNLQYDLQMPVPNFLEVLHRWKSPVFALEMTKKVPDTLRHDSIRDLPNYYQVLTMNGWQLTFALTYPGEYAEITTRDRVRLEKLLHELEVLGDNIP